MDFNVASLLKEPTGAIREHDIDDDLIVETERHHVTGRVRFDRTNVGMLVRATMRGAMATECSRCLRPMTSAVEISLEEEYLPTLDPHTGAPVVAPEGQEDAYRIDARNMLHLSLAAQQYWQLAMPMAPVCFESCRGLCPVCGQELNSGDHECAGEQFDARWEKLARLRQS